jgi:hypothetical protein
VLEVRIVFRTVLEVFGESCVELNCWIHKEQSGVVIAIRTLFETIE